MAEALDAVASVDDPDPDEVVRSGLGGYPPLPGQETHQEQADLAQFPP